MSNLQRRFNTHWLSQVRRLRLYLQQSVFYVTQVLTYKDKRTDVITANNLAATDFMTRNDISHPDTLDDWQLPLQQAALQVWAAKYQRRDAHRHALEHTIADSLARVATAISHVESGRSSQREWQQKFLWALRRGAIPGGRIMANAGTDSDCSTINCTVAGPITGEATALKTTLAEAQQTLQAQCGIGYDFSALSSTTQPRHAPLDTIRALNALCDETNTTQRRGAQMGVLDIAHADIEAFIRAKHTPGELSCFNLSVLVSDAFIDALDHDRIWPLVASGDNKPVKEIRARELWQQLLRSSYDTGDPGVLFIDRINAGNNNWFCENIRATNPCGEQPLPAYGSCLLGSIDLTRFVLYPFRAQACFDWQGFRDVVAVFTRMLDNVADIANLPLAQQRFEMQHKRRHGMGVLGLGSALALLGIRYGSLRSRQFLDRVCRELVLTGWKTGVQLAQEKGAAPIMHEQFIVSDEMLQRNPRLHEDGIRRGDSLPGRVLLGRYSQHLQLIARHDRRLARHIIEHGARFTHHSSIAPTGTIALALANNASSGIEPTFALQQRRAFAPASDQQQWLELQALEWLAWQHRPASITRNMPRSFVSAHQVTPEQHLQMQATAQRWIDGAISKTINIPTDYPFEDFASLYRKAYALGVKGCTVFRFNPSRGQQVLCEDPALERECCDALTPSPSPAGRGGLAQGFQRASPLSLRERGRG